MPDSRARKRAAPLLESGPTTYSHNTQRDHNMSVNLSSSPPIPTVSIEVTRERARLQTKTARRVSDGDSFWAFHLRNPHVYAYIRDHIQNQVEQGFQRCAVAQAAVNFRYSVAGTAGNEYKFCNNYSPYYARLIGYWESPDLSGTLEYKKSSADQWFQIKFNGAPPPKVISL